jgi:hypothetical protein
MGKRGAQPWEPNWEDFDKLLSIQCTIQEIVAYYTSPERPNLSVDTIERAVKRVHKMKFADYRDLKAPRGHVSLRRIMWQKALAGDKTLIIWLCKQYLGMTDKTQVTVETMTASQLDALIDKIIGIIQKDVTVAAGTIS